MNALFNGDGWSSFEVLAYILIFAYLAAPIACIVVFILRKEKFWFNYVALAGELLFFIKILFHIQHYPGQFELSLAGTPCLVVAFIASLRAEKQGKIRASMKLGVILCLYGLMFLNLSSGIFSYYHNALPDTKYLRRDLTPNDTRFMDSIRKLYKLDSLHGDAKN